MHNPKQVLKQARDLEFTLYFAGVHTVAICVKRSDKRRYASRMGTLSVMSVEAPILLRNQMNCFTG